MSYQEVAKRVKLPEEIDKKYKDESLRLGDWIQRKIENKRINPIVEYINKQKQQFFNSLVLGIYDGKPTWQDIGISRESVYNEEYDEEKIDYYKKSFGILNLYGNESIFAIDGQHRASGIRRAIKENKANLIYEVPVIFVGHSTDVEGKIRTRRLFSTLNRYAKPVSESEKIALSEDDNCAIITRKLVEEFDLLKNRILVNKSRSIHPSQKDYFTSIMVLYDIVKTLLVEKSIPGIGSVSGKDKSIYLHVRAEDEEINNDFRRIKRILKETINSFLLLGVSLETMFLQTEIILKRAFFFALLVKIYYLIYSKLEYQKDKKVIH